MKTDDLTTLKDDMIAFIEGHGMRHFPALIPEDTPRVWWSDPEHAADGDIPESWKDFVEMAKSVAAPMVLIGEDSLDSETLALLATELEEVSSAEMFSAQMEKLDRVSRQSGKLGHIELGFAHQGILFVHESATSWYREYREMVDMIDDLQDLIGSRLDDDEDEG